MPFPRDEFAFFRTRCSLGLRNVFNMLDNPSRALVATRDAAYFFRHDLCALLGSGQEPALMVDDLLTGPAFGSARGAERHRRRNLASIDFLLDLGRSVAEIFPALMHPNNLIRVQITFLFHQSLHVFPGKACRVGAY
jgi:hypothetical protein